MGKNVNERGAKNKTVPNQKKQAQKNGKESGRGLWTIIERILGVTKNTFGVIRNFLGMIVYWKQLPKDSERISDFIELIKENFMNN